MQLFKLAVIGGALVVTSLSTSSIISASNADITIAPNGTGVVDVQGSMNSSVSGTGKSIVFGF